MYLHCKFCLWLYPRDKIPSKCPFKKNKNGTRNSYKSAIQSMSFTISISDIPKSPVPGYKCSNPSRSSFSHRSFGLLTNPCAFWRLSPMLRMSFLTPFTWESLYISSPMQHPLKIFCPFPRVSWTFPITVVQHHFVAVSIKYLIWGSWLFACLSLPPDCVSRTETCLLRQE